MKKNIGYVNLDSSIALWLMEHLPPGELKNGIEDLLNKECSSLILESDTDELSVWDHSVIRLRYAGNLSEISQGGAKRNRDFSHAEGI